MHVIDEHHFEAMKDGAIVANSGHFNVEINIPALEEMASRARTDVRDFVEEYKLRRRPQASTCWARAGWSTWPPPKATPPA